MPADHKPEHRTVPEVPLHPAIQATADHRLRLDPRRGLNRLCDISDWRAGRVCDVMHELGYGPRIFRKAWEQATCLEGFERLEILSPDARVLSVGAGMERPLFWLANRVARVVATDLYGPEWGFDDENDFVSRPQRYAPFAYREDHLEVARMSGTDLRFADGSFDAVYTLSSIEHFGDHDAARQSVLEIGRVLRPGGVACVVTELLLSRFPTRERFTPDEMKRYLIADVGMALVEAHIDLRISESLLSYPVNFSYETDLSISPHIVLIDADGNMWTSVNLFFRKPGT